MAHEVTVFDVTYGVAAEGFATSGDVYVCLGDILPDMYAGPTADGRPADRPCAVDRLRRALCADQVELSVHAVDRFASALATAQVARIAAAIGRVRSRCPSIQRAVVAGLGGFIAARAARAAGLEVDLLDGRESPASQCAPAVAVAVVLERLLNGGAGRKRSRRGPWILDREPLTRVIKVGGSLLAYPDVLQRLMLRLPKARSALIVPGGGVFADAVRALDTSIAPTDSRAHWMAVLAMDQYAEILVEQLQGTGVRVETLAEARSALTSNHVPVLAPSRWLRTANPLPHSWDVTSDSIAAWVAGQAGAKTLVLVKPPGATGQLTDAYFEQALPRGVALEIVRADDKKRLDAALGVLSPSDIEQLVDGFVDEE